MSENTGGLDLAAAVPAPSDSSMSRQSDTQPLVRQSGPVRVGFSPDGALFATASDNTVRLWNVQTHQPTGTEFTNIGRDATAVTFSPDSTLLAASSNSQIHFWDLSKQG